MIEKRIKYLGFGSPLIDMIADVDKEFLLRNNLKLDETIHRKLDDSGIVADVEKTATLTFVPGGCCYNTMRIFNWMLKGEGIGTVGLIGSVGKDRYGDKFEELLRNENIQPIFEKIEAVPTGMCLVYLYNKDRGHITDLGASKLITNDFFNNCMDIISEVDLVYTELFFIKDKRNMLFQLGNQMLDSSKLFGFNLPSFYFIENFLNDIVDLMEYADVIFSNAAEASYFSKLALNSKDDDLDTICEMMCKKIGKKSKEKQRVVVITNGPNPAYYCCYDFENGLVKGNGTVGVCNVSENDIVDSNGAGDAFAGGFLSQYIQGKDVETCMYAGHWAAAEIIKVRGCQIASKCDFNI